MGLREGFKDLKIPTVNQLINIELCKFFYKLVHKKLSTNLMNCVLSNNNNNNFLFAWFLQYNTSNKDTI